jgi:hypothetical protein
MIFNCWQKFRNGSDEYEQEGSEAIRKLIAPIQIANMDDNSSAQGDHQESMFNLKKENITVN